MDITFSIAGKVTKIFEKRRVGKNGSFEVVDFVLEYESFPQKFQCVRFQAIRDAAVDILNRVCLQDQIIAEFRVKGRLADDQKYYNLLEVFKVKKI